MRKGVDVKWQRESDRKRATSRATNKLTLQEAEMDFVEYEELQAT
jgi:hypothetical protein